MLLLTGSNGLMLNVVIRTNAMYMKLPVLLLSFILFISICTNAQKVTYNNKLSAGLKLFLASENPDSRFLNGRKNKTYVPVIIEVSDRKAASLLTTYNAIVHTIAGSIITAELSTDDILQIASLSEVIRIELPLLLTKTDEKMKDIIHASEVHKGINPLSQPYKGKGVVVGIIDDGIDISHPDFYTSAGECRIKYFWNMDYNNYSTPSGFSYGFEWTKDTLERYAGLYTKQKAFTRYQMEKMFGYSFHGTSVAGLAAGNNGVAPEADIIAVALTAFGDTILRSDRLIDAIRYIESKARAENKKCVINISLGLSDGAPHDGKSLVEKAIDNFCLENENLLICVSAGNNGNNWKHWGGFPIDKDSSYSFFYSSSIASLYFAIPKQYRDSISISVAESNLGSLNAPNINRDSIFYQSPFFKIAELQNSTAPVSVNSKDRTGATRSVLTFSSSPYNSNYDEMILKVDALPRNNSQAFDPHLYRFIVKGNGTVHAWFPFGNLHPVFLFDRNPLPGDPAFHLSDNAYTTNIPSNAFTVLSVGAYNIRTCYVNMKKKVVTQYPACQLAFFTSHGPTLDGRIKPDLVAPGDNVMSSRSRYQDYYDFDFIIDTNTVSFGGTSASSPIVAGAAALLWQKFPLLTRDSIKALLKNNTTKDTYTEQPGSTPNNLSGWGKLDVFKAMTGIALTPFNCNTVDTCKGANIPPPPPPVITPVEYFKIYPNPAPYNATLEYYTTRNFTMKIYDSKGRKVSEQFVFAVPGIARRMLIPTFKYSNGVYFLTILPVGTQEKKAFKLVVLH
jgi:minor extracellular serine protease Vpr